MKNHYQKYDKVKAIRLRDEETFFIKYLVSVMKTNPFYLEVIAQRKQQCFLTRQLNNLRKKTNINTS